MQPCLSMSYLISVDPLTLLFLPLLQKLHLWLVLIISSAPIGTVMTLVQTVVTLAPIIAQSLAQMFVLTSVLTTAQRHRDAQTPVVSLAASPVMTLATILATMNPVCLARTLALIILAILVVPPLTTTLIFRWRTSRNLCRNSNPRSPSVNIKRCSKPITLMSRSLKKSLILPSLLTANGLTPMSVIVLRLGRPILPNLVPWLLARPSTPTSIRHRGETSWSPVRRRRYARATYDLLGLGGGDSTFQFQDPSGSGGVFGQIMIRSRSGVGISPFPRIRAGASEPDPTWSVTTGRRLRAGSEVEHDCGPASPPVPISSMTNSPRDLLTWVVMRSTPYLPTYASSPFSPRGYLSPEEAQ